MSTFTDRIIRAAQLDPQLYEEVEADSGSLGEAMKVVLLSSLAAGLGAIGQLGLFGLVLTTVSALMGWYIWAYLTYAIGTYLLPEARTQADLGQLLRTTGFAAAPGLLRLFGFIPAVGPLIVFAASIWMLVAMVVAVRQALDFTTTGRALMVCFVGFLVQALVIAGIFLLFGEPLY